MGKEYFIRKHMFFAVTYPIMDDCSYLTREEAIAKCKKMNDDELKYGDGHYTCYKVHRLDNISPEIF